MNISDTPDQEHTRYGSMRLISSKTKYQDGEPMSQEHVDVKYFRLDECGGLEMNEINKLMLNKLI